MIHPNMGTMLAFLTTDCAITQEMLEDAPGGKGPLNSPWHTGPGPSWRLRRTWPNAECWGCDLTYEYVKINGDYRT